MKHSGRYIPLIHGLVITIAAVIAYSNTFSASFHLDDYPYIVENPIIREMKFFLEPSLAKEYQAVFGYHTLKMRYVGFLTFALNYQIHGLDVAGYHILNLIIHIINCLLVYLFVIECFASPVLDSLSLQDRGRQIALFTALIFCVHPIQTQAVTYITQRFTSLATLFFLLSLLTYIKARMSNSSPARYGYYTASIISTVLAMKTKEIAFTLPFMLILFDALFLPGPLKLRMQYLVLPLSATLIIPAGLYFFSTVTGSLSSKILHATAAETMISWQDYLLTQFRVIITYLRLLVLPINQNVDYDYPIFTSLFDPNVVLPMVALVAFIGCAVYLVFRSYRAPTKSLMLRLPAFGILWFFITLSVESTFIPILDVIFEHRLYLPSVGLILSAVTYVFIIESRYRRNHPGLGKIIFALLVAVVIVLLGATYSRNAVWADEITLWQDVVTKSTRNPRAHLNLGSAYSEKGDLDKAFVHYQVAMDLKPDYAEAHNGIGLVYMYRGLLNEASAHYDAALRSKPGYAAAHYNYGLLYFGQGERYYDRARDALEEALRADPAYDDARKLIRYIERANHRNVSQP